jgi:hypothetical protein
VTLTVISALRVSYIAMSLAVAGHAMPISRMTGTSVHTISSLVLCVKFTAGDGALGMAELEHRVDHRAEHDDADHHAHPQRHHVRFPRHLRGVGDALAHVELPGMRRVRLGDRRGEARRRPRQRRTPRRQADAHAWRRRC